MKKILSIILAVIIMLGAISITAFAEDNTTEITVTVAKTISYDMVIPEDVTNINAAGVYTVGQAKVANVNNATDNTVISYTAETTDFKCEGKSDIPASYYTDAQGATVFPATAVEVYKNKEDAASIPTMYVGISESDWNDAENGTYTATVTFNFKTEKVEKAQVKKISEIMPDEFPISQSGSSWRSKTGMGALYTNDGKLKAYGPHELELLLSTETTLTTEGNYSCNGSEGETWTFIMNGEKFNKIIISGAESMMDGEYYKGAIDF